MISRKIGPFRVFPLGLGCMNLSHGYGRPARREDSEHLLNHALDRGVNFLDTAAIYGSGENERLLGQAVMHRRQEFTLASKCVLCIRDGKRVLDGRPEAILSTLEDSLRRLATDHIDIYYLHRLDRNVPIEESVGALARAVSEGKIGSIGLSEMSAETIRRAHSTHPISAVQSEYSAWVRNPEIAVLETCRDLSIGFVAFSPVGRGFLAGSVNSPEFEKGDIRSNMPRFNNRNIGHNLHLLERFRAIGDELGLSPAQLALAWVLSRGDHIVPIVGTQRIDHLDENIEAVSARLPPEAISAAEELFSPDAVAGARYSLQAASQIDTETFPDEHEA